MNMKQAINCLYPVWKASPTPFQSRKRRVGDPPLQGCKWLECWLVPDSLVLADSGLAFASAGASPGSHKWLPYKANAITYADGTSALPV